MRTRVGWLLVLAGLMGSNPAAAQVPGAPTGVTGRPMNGSVLVSFTPPVNTGGSAITVYTVTANPSMHPPVSGTASPIEVGVPNGTPVTFTVTATNSSGVGPASAASAPVTPEPVTAPADAPVTLTVGPVTITTYNPVTITPLENSTNLYFVATNTSTQAVTLEFTSWEEIQSTKPGWLYHFFKLFGLESIGQGRPALVPLAAGETRTLTFFTSKDLGCGAECGVPGSFAGTPQSTTLPFRFRVGSAVGTLNITFDASDLVNQFFTVRSAIISGRVTSPNGSPIVGALVTASSFTSTGVATTVQSGRQEKEIRQTRTGTDGRYRLDLMSMTDVRKALGARTLPYQSLDYFLTAEADGYSMAYRGGLSPATGETLTTNIVLTPQAQRTAFSQVGELATNGHLAYWWIRFAGHANDRVVAVQGQHPPVSPTTPQTHIIAVDLTGHELWRVPTDMQCWGLDVSPDGRLIAAGCDDHFLYVVTEDGVLLHKIAVGDRPGGGYVEDIRFSPDGTRILADGGNGTGGFTVFNVQTGAVMWKSVTANVTPGEETIAAYKCRWSPDGARVVCGSNGPLAMFTADGALVWKTTIGESPLWLEVDSANNVYAAGKSRELFSFDKDGNRRWSFRLSHTSNEAWKGITADGSLMVMPSFDGTIQAVTSQGTVAWQHVMPTLQTTSPQNTLVDFIWGTGHNALSMTPSGDRIAVGSRGNQALVYDRNGTLVWSHTAPHRTDFQGDDPMSHGNYTGTTAIAMSPDGRYVAAGYAESVIRIFALQPTINASPSALKFAATKAGASGAIGASTAAQSITLAFPIGSPAWTAATTTPWLQISNSAGTGAGRFTVSIADPTNAIGGSTSLTGSITITAPGAENSPVTIPVTLTVDQTSGSASVAPFGQVDTPIQNASGVQGAIGVTGWVVDDIGVTSVKIYRNCLSFEAQASCQMVKGHNVVFIGDAAFLAGARTDVENAFSAYPASNRAGWGYLLLTSMLPHVTNQLAYGGQGPLTLYAVATDAEGHTTLLGRSSDSASPDFATPTMVTMANDSIAKPFGAIDTPAQGQTVSGVLNNFGWALTPDSNTGAGAGDILIPTNGSTMTVFIDALPVALVTYNQCRGNVGNPVPAGQFCNDDVANIFGNSTPQPVFTARTANATLFRNLDATRGAIGSYSFNTSTLSNGLHTIAWSVTDSSNRTEGIGSRFFNVLNAGADTMLRAAPAQVLGTAAALDRSRPATEGVFGRTGFDLDAAWRQIHADESGVFSVRLPEMGRLELWLGDAVDAGYLVANGTLRPLPVGATLSNQYFAWMPPVGYVGNYVLAFIRGDARIDVNVKVAPRAATQEGEPEIRMHLDAVQVEGQVLGQRTVRVQGWAFDPQASLGSGIAHVHVWVRRIDSGSAPAFFAGAATLDLAHRGFALTTSLPEGSYALTAYAWNERTGRWEDARTVTVVVR